jgi:hypothetical protein
VGGRDESNVSRTAHAITGTQVLCRRHRTIAVAYVGGRSCGP